MIKGDLRLIVILLSCIVLSSFALNQYQIYYANCTDDLICQFIILPNDHTALSGIRSSDKPVYIKGEIYTDRTVKYYVVEWNIISPLEWIKEDISPVENNIDKLTVVKDECVKLSVEEYKKCIDYAHFISKIGESVPFDNIGRYAVDCDNIGIKYKDKWYDFRHLTDWSNNSDSLQPKWLAKTKLGEVITNKVYNDFWYGGIYDIFYKKIES